MFRLNANTEQRRYLRGVASESELLTVELPTEAGPMQTGVVLDISERGIGVQLFRSPAPNGLCNLHLRLPGSKTSMETPGAIAWIGRSKRAGIRFSNPSPETNAQIREWVRKHPSQPLSQTASRKETDEDRSSLQFIVERARSVRGASGAAIAVGDEQGMECCASAGDAPGIGATLHPGSGLSGLCLRTGSTVRCSDSLSDPRVDVGVAKRLNMRSALILPARVSGRIAGILEVFSSEPNAFTGSAVENQLEILMRFLSVAIEDSKALEKAKSGNTALVAAEKKTAYASIHSALSSPPAKIYSAITAVILGAVLSGYIAQRHHNFMRAPIPPSAADVVNTVAKTPPTISFAPATLSERVGSSFSVDVVLNNAQNVSSVPLLVEHNPDMLQFVAVTIGALPGPSGVLVHREERGAIQLTASRTSSTPGMTGNGVVCTLVFVARAPGKSQLSIGQAALRDSAMHVITAEGSSATVTIHPRPTQND